MFAFWIWALAYAGLGAYMCVCARRAFLGASAHSPTPEKFNFPRVTVVKPVKGVNPYTKINFSSWLEQKYPTDVEYIFSFQDPDDRALPIARALAEVAISRDTSLKIQILVNPIRDGFSGKTSNLYYGAQAASHEFLIFSDADMLASSELVIRDIVLRAERTKSIVSCLPIHTSPDGSWAQFYMSLWNATLAVLWAGAMYLRRSPGVAGGTLGFYRSDLEQIGGVASFAHSIAEDLKMGALFLKKGYRFELGPLIESQVGRISRSQCWNAFMRGAYVTWNNEQGGLLRAIPLYLFAYSYIVLLPWAIIVNSPAVKPLILIYVVRVLVHSYSNWIASGKFQFSFHVFFNDLMMVAAILYSFYKRELEWAGVRYKILKDGGLKKI